MKKASFAGLGLCLALGGAACGSDGPAVGPPELVQLVVVGPDGAELDLLAVADGGVPVLSPLSTWRAVFNQLLDGRKIEEVLDGGGTAERGDVVTLLWPDAPAGAPAIAALTAYNPAGALGVNVPGPSVRVQAQPGLPSSARMELRLLREKITGKRGAPFVGPDAHSFETAPFSATTNLPPGGTVASDFDLRLSFSNLPADDLADHVAVTADGMPVTVEIVPDPGDPAVLVISPSADSGWSAGRAHLLIVPAAASDLFGVALDGGPLMVAFQIAASGSDAGAGGDGGAAADAP